MKIKNGHGIDPYIYCLKNPVAVRLLGLLGLVATLLMAYGFIRFFNLSVWYWIIFAPIAAIFIYDKLIRNFIQLFYPKFDVAKHKSFVKRFWETHKEPAVDVFLPWAGESLSMYAQVLQGVKEIEYRNINIYVLDDKGSDELKELAKKFNYKYLSRPNKGEYRKAGNLQYGYDHADGEFVLVLDADFMPHSKILKYTIPYIVRDKKIGILQTPQYFEQTGSLHKKNPLEFGAGNVVEDFYKVDMPSRDRFRATMCVGTSAIYRKEAIVKCGGPPKVEGTEDVRQGFKVWSVGYYVKYIPLVLSMGKTPDDYQSYFRQHNRWCSGSLDAITGKYFWRAKLSLFARIIYTTNLAYYISEALSVIFSFHLLALLFFHNESLSIVNAIWFLPYLIFNRLIVPATRINKQRFGSRLAAYNNIFTYLYSVPRTPVKGMLKWHPAGAKMSKLQKEYKTTINIGLVFALIYVMFFVFIIFSKPYILGNYNTYLVLFWALNTATWYSLFISLTTQYIKKVRLPEILKMKQNHKVIRLTFLNMKSYLMPMLTAFLILIIGLNGRVELSNPDAPTVMAMNTILDIGNEEVIEQEKKEDLMVVLISGSIDYESDSVSILGVTSDEGTYKYRIGEGDDLTNIVEKASIDFKNNQGIELTQAEKLYLELKIAQDIDFKLLEEGDIIEINESKMKEIYLEGKEIINT